MTFLEFQRFLRLPGEHGWIELRYFKPGAKGPPDNQGWLDWPPQGDEDIPLPKKLEVYAGVLVRTTKGKGDSAHVGQGSQLWIDYDLDGTLYLEDWEDKELVPPHVLEAAARAAMNDLLDRCEELGLPPRLIVYSGHGLQIYWGTDRLMDPKWISSVCKGLQSYFEADPQSVDRARILRVPGSYNNKNQQRPLPVAAWHKDNARLPPDAFEAYKHVEKLPALPPSIEQAFKDGLTPWTPADADLRLVIQNWGEGQRHHLAMSFGGWCASHGVPQVTTEDMVRRICHEADDAELDDRVKTVQTSYARYQKGQSVLGWTALKQLIPALQGRGRVVIATLTKPKERHVDTPSGPVLPPEYREGEFGELYLVKIFETKNGLQEDQELLAPRMLYVDEVLRDLSSGEMHLRLSWRASGGELITESIPFGDAITRQGLLRLGAKGAPVDELNAGLLTRYIQRTYAVNLDALPTVDVTSTIGWHRGAFHVPGEVQVLGVDPDAWEPRGDVQAWLEALRALLSWGETPALVLTAAAAAAPAVRPLKLSKNPVLALSTTSHSGKTTSAAFALSMWANPSYGEGLYFDATTLSGLMAKMMVRQDLPVSIDDHQRYKDHEVNELLHLLAGGAEKVRARRDGSERTARRWRGIAFLTGESTAIREAMGTGALNRLIELTDYPLGVGKGQTGLERATILRTGSLNHATVRKQLLELHHKIPAAEAVPKYARWVAQAGAPGDMCEGLGVIAYGAQLLCELTGSTLPIPEQLLLYLSEKLAELRQEHGSLAGRAMNALRNLLISYRRDINAPEIFDGGGQLLAFQKVESSTWYVNPTARAVVQTLESFGGLELHLAEWARNDWIEVETTKGKKRYRLGIMHRGQRSYWVGLKNQIEEPDDA